jgi:hypothetical protein
MNKKKRKKKVFLGYFWNFFYINKLIFYLIRGNLFQLYFKKRKKKLTFKETNSSCPKLKILHTKKFEINKN